ncbi:hypothetical protein M501DRAFT_1020301 [Patellaria atrata CBS 101060]|uniref:Uncharacterized protein n=1 Tax=Patellaria atrata CBS 101060 TaxID=1346257 RepID=A0A9P4VL24_9PEZI|nr:hypothetical protein M501DRAFT_1020301 [Patellaria atrata CBS 101060]
MKITLLALATLLASASAQSCKAIRIKDERNFPPLTPLCSDSQKVGDQDESDKCSKSHGESCYKVVSATDTRCNLYIYGSDGCDEGDTLLNKIPCIQGQSWYFGGKARYVVRCP